jgi:hypothetical protein
MRFDPVADRLLLSLFVKKSTSPGPGFIAENGNADSPGEERTGAPRPARGLADQRYLKRTTAGAVWTGLAIALALAWRFGSPAGTGFAVGLGWALANFWALAGLLRAGVNPRGRETGKAIAFGALKVVLYGAGIALLVSGVLPVAALAAGFGWLFVTIVLRAAGAMLVERGAAPRS